MQLPLETEALVVNGVGDDFEMTPIVIQDLRPDEVLVEMKYSGVCHTVCAFSTRGPVQGKANKPYRTFGCSRVLSLGSRTSQSLPATRVQALSARSEQRSRTSPSKSATPSYSRSLLAEAAGPVKRAGLATAGHFHLLT